MSGSPDAMDPRVCVRCQKPSNQDYWCETCAQKQLRENKRAVPLAQRARNGLTSVLGYVVSAVLGVVIVGGVLLMNNYVASH